MKTPLIVRMWGDEVGRLNWDFRRRTSYFQFNADFISKGLDVFPIVAPIAMQDRWSTCFGEEEKMYKHLPSFIADSLPDAWGSQLLELWRKQQQLAIDEMTSLESLAYIGQRAMGALEFEPAIPLQATNDKVDVRDLAKLANRILQEREKVQLSPAEAVTMQALMQIGTSAGGMRPKAIIAMNQDGEIRSGQVAHQEGFDYYILKFGDKTRQTAELEMAYYRMAIESGIEMNECRLWEVDGVNHFLTKRFDRVNGEKVHMQTMAAMMPEARSYDHLFYICRRLQLSQEMADELFRRMVFNILANNTDDHCKNFSFLMNRAGQWRISPAYDLTYVFDEGGYTPYRFHCLTIAGKTCQITMDDVVAFARNNSIRNPEGIIRKIAAVIERFPEIAARYGVRSEWIDRVWTTLQENLHDWHLYAYPNESPYRFELAYKGNYHLFVRQADGRERRYVIRPKMPEYDVLQQQGIAAISDEQVAAWVAAWNKSC